MQNPGVTHPSDTSGVSDAAIDRVFARAGAERWGLSRAAFATTIRYSLAKHAASTGRAVASFEDGACDQMIDSLHAEDLALACACAEGLEAAWEHFVLTYRPDLYRAARAMSDETTGRELADSLYADLFGMHERAGERQSLFRYYHGRAKLGTWLRSVLAQRHVDLVRAQRRTTSLDDPDGDPGREPVAPSAGDPVRAASMRMAAGAVTAALGTLVPADRTRLAYYYAHGLTLAQAGRLFGESEATASRKLDRARRTLRAAITAHLSDRGVDVADVDDWAAVAREAWDTTLVEALGVARPQDDGPPSFKDKKRTP
jgi:RNA polymerase sigma-70 factor, ECF subfamily